VTVDGVIARVQARRRVKWGSFGALLGCGAILVSALVVPALTTDNPPADDPSNSGVLGPSSNPSGTADHRSKYEIADAWWGTCSSKPLAIYPPGNTDLFSISTNLAPNGFVDSNQPLEIDVTVEALTSSDVLVNGVDAAILYDGRVVGAALNADIVQLHRFDDGETLTETVSLPLVICNGAVPLGPGDYTLVVSMGYNPNVEGTAPEDGGEGMVAPRVVAEPIAFSIAGDPATNPLNQPQTAGSAVPPLPDNLLTAPRAESLFAPAMKENEWDMAPGTSRWIVPVYEQSTILYNSSSPYDFCGYSGLVDGTFPSTSAMVDLIEEKATLPDSIRLRYGWVVEGEPLLDLTLENTSGFSIPNFGSLNQVSLYLVDDGVLAGVGYAIDIDSYSQSGSSSSLTPASGIDPFVAYYGFTLWAPGPVAQGHYVMQELHPCSTAGNDSSLAPGTYTVLTVLDLYLDISGASGDYGQVQLWTVQGTLEIVD
jgi:hypothetical protein